MLPARFAFLVLVPFALVACASADPTDDAAADTMEAMTVDIPMIGTFENPDGALGELSRLVLKTDGTFHAETPVACTQRTCDSSRPSILQGGTGENQPCTIVRSCDPLQQDGFYDLYEKNGHNYLLLRTQQGASVGHYEYFVGDQVLALDKINTLIHVTSRPAWRFLFESSAWCAFNTDCAHQNLPSGQCAGEYSCLSNTCNWTCETRPLDLETAPPVHWTE